MKQAVVLGAGMVGGVMAADLVRDGRWRVTVADVNETALSRLAGERSIETIRADLSDPTEIRRIVADADVVLGALASALGFAALRAVIEAGKPYCDISFMAEDALELDGLAKERGVTAVVDCGVAPGLSNLLVGYGVSQLDRVERVAIYVGGVPRERRWPFEYKAGFSPHDVIEEYTRPARLVENGRVVVKEALSDVELLDFEGLGTLEAFNTDGLRSLIRTIDAPTMIEKTMRYPGHAALMRVFRETGLFSKEPVAVGRSGATVRPLDVTAAVMFPKWTYQPGEPDLTVMRIDVEGQREERQERLRWDLVDEYDVNTGWTSMSRTTAFPCAIVARLLASGEINRPGVHAPEVLGRDESIVRRILDELERRGVSFRSHREER